ncbi:MAG: hypothetical protein EXS55_01415 [Candidatus Magasanikbacteria bacterium]|nr:hypothetical protein [Candidatus Magasanikbacteria bacterium]
MRGITDVELKKQAITLRRRGYTFPMIEQKLGVPRATLSGWFSGLKLSPIVYQHLLARKRRHLVAARKKALKILKNNRDERAVELNSQIQNEFSTLVLSVQQKELLLAMLYLGEGFKKRSTIALGNSNPRILSMFVQLVREIYQLQESKFRCFLYLRADQDQEKEKKFWSKILHIPLSQFRKSQHDKRTLGKKTWKGYHGVCAVYCYDATIEKRLTILQQLLLEKILSGP